MDSYYADLTNECLHNSIKELNRARQYAKSANAPDWLLSNLTKTIHAIQNRIDDITALRENDD